MNWLPDIKELCEGALQSLADRNLAAAVEKLWQALQLCMHDPTFPRLYGEIIEHLADISGVCVSLSVDAAGQRGGQDALTLYCHFARLRHANVFGVPA